jgi:hypothetical protein
MQGFEPKKSQANCATPGCFRTFTTTAAEKCPTCLARHADDFWKTMGDQGRPETTRAQAPLQPLQFQLSSSGKH